MDWKQAPKHRWELAAIYCDVKSTLRSLVTISWRIAFYWMRFFIALIFYALTVLYAWNPELWARSELIGGSPAKALRLLTILSVIALTFLTATIEASFDIVWKTLAARTEGNHLLDHGSLQPGASLTYLFKVLAVSKQAAEGGLWKSRGWAALKLISMSIVPILNIVITSQVDTVMKLYAIKDEQPAYGYEMGNFNASLAELLRPETDSIIPTTWKEFFTNSNLNVDLTTEAQQAACNLALQRDAQDVCQMTYFTPGGQENFAPITLTNSGFNRSDSIQPIIADDARGYIFEFNSTTKQVPWGNYTSCVSHGYSFGAWELCLENVAANRIDAYIRTCPLPIASNTSCLSDPTWRSEGQGWKTTFDLYDRRANIGYSGVNGTIMTYEFSQGAQNPVNISANELLSVFDTLFSPANKTDKFDVAINAVGLATGSPFASLSIWQYLQGLDPLSQINPQSNRRAIVAFQSLLALPIYHCQAKDFAELRQLLVKSNNTVGSLAQQIISGFPEATADTKIWPAVLRYNINVGKGSLIAYTVIDGFTLIICLVAHIIGLWMLLAERHVESTSNPSLNNFFDYVIQPNRPKEGTLSQNEIWSLHKSAEEGWWEWMADKKVLHVSNITTSSHQG